MSVDLDSLPVTLTDIERAAELLEGVIERTPGRPFACPEPAPGFRGVLQV